MKFHKKFHVVALLAAIFALNAQAAEVQSAQVVRAVSAWSAANGSAFATPGSVTGATPVAENGTNLYWIVTMSNGGAVIASPDTDIDLVIAVLEKSDGTFPAGHPLPSILKADMRNRLSIIRGATASSGSSAGGSGVRMASVQSASSQSTTASDLPEDVKDSIEKANAQWSKYDRANGGVGLLAATRAANDPNLIVRRVVDGFEEGGRFTHWNQGKLEYDKASRLCYNYYTPGNSVCGCVATAAAAVMQFFGVTNDIKSVGTLPSIEAMGLGCTYEGKPYPCKTKPGALDWSIVPDTDDVDVIRGAAVRTNEICELFGRVTYNVGVLVGMGWTSEASGAVTALLPDVFKAYGFNTARWVSYEGSDAGQFMKTIYAQNRCGAPVILSIDGTPGGHAVVACGSACDEFGDDYCRVFMGWGGSSDAWYKFPKIASFSIVEGAVTMIGYEDDAVVPVYGSANMPGITLSIPGYKDAEGNDVESQAVEVNGEGYFGVRVPLSLPAEARVISYTNRNPAVSFPIEPFDPDVLADETKFAADEIDEALPNEVFFSLLNMTLCPTVEAGRAVALRDGKALLMVSGNASGERTKKLLEQLYYLDENSNISNKFVMVFTSVNSTAVNGVDGDPAIGVFDPAIGSADGRWWEANGRLVYENFIDSVDEDGKIVYTIDDMTELDVRRMIVDMLESGYTQHQRNHSGIEVTVEGVNIHNGAVESFNMGTPSPAYGVYSNSWTNCEAVVFSAPGVYTNIEEGVVYACVGWTTNGVFGSNGQALYETGTEITLNIATNSVFTFAWVWDATHYKVTAASDSGVGFVTPDEVWCEADGRITITAASDGEYVLDREWPWDIWTLNNADYMSLYGNEAYVSMNGNTISFSVHEPVEVVAYYTDEASYIPPVKSYTVDIAASPDWITDEISLKGGYAWGSNTIIDQFAYLSPTVQSYVDVTGGVWICTGWEIDGIKYEGASYVCELASGSSIAAKCLWELSIPDVDPDDGGEGDDDGEGEGEEEGDVTPTLLPIAFSSIEKISATEWTLTITNAVKGCWYTLYDTDSLSPVPVQWDKAADPVQAESDGPLVFTVPANGDARFWKVKADTVKEEP